MTCSHLSSVIESIPTPTIFNQTARATSEPNDRPGSDDCCRKVSLLYKVSNKVVDPVKGRNERIGGDVSGKNLSSSPSQISITALQLLHL